MVDFKNLDNQEAILISLTGGLVSKSAMDFKRDIINLVEDNAKDCYINISNVEAMDVSGVNALAMVHKATERAGNKLVIVSSDANPADEFLMLTKFNEYLNFARA